VGTAELLAGLRLVDHHCHGVVRGELDRPGFEALLSEAGPPPAGVTNFDTPLGLAVRRHCSPLLDLEPHASPERYLERRSALGVDEVTGRLLRAAGLGTLLVDTGYRGDELLSPGELGAVAGAAAHEVIRLESVAESVAGAGVAADEFLGECAKALADAVAVKSVAAYRIGFDFDPRPPATAEVREAAAEWLRRGAPYRLAEPTLIRALLWTAVELGRPIQFHVGYGDADIRLHRTNPSLLTDFLRAVPHRVPVLLLHCWPYQREASYLAAVLPHIYLDVGLALNHVGPSRAAAVLAEALEVTPFGKLLYSSDAFGLPELYHLGALVFRRALAELLDARVAAGEWSAGDAERLARMIAVDNATRVYHLAP
jgi:predicted TIM-barrel fold metal-dependent hydrolase